MVKFSKPTKQGGGFSLSFKTGARLDEETLSEQARETVQLCRQLISTARSRILQQIDEEVYSYAQFYFQLDHDGFNLKKDKIKKWLSQLETALNNSFLIKITDRITRKSTPETADGYTRVVVKSIAKKPSGESPAENRSSHLFPPTQIDPAAAFVGTKIDTSGKARIETRRMKLYGASYVAGNVQIKATLLPEPRSAAEVLLHEFCHKYLGFHDGPISSNDPEERGRWYFGPEGNTPIDVQAYSKITVSRAVMRTADAMAWFIVKVGHKMESQDKIAINPTPPPSGGEYG